MKKTIKGNKKKYKKNYLRLGLTILVVFLIGILGMSLKNVISLHVEQNQLKDANKELKSEKSSLETELKNVNDKSYIEEQARIQLRLIKPGEILYILKDDEGSKDKE